MHILPGMKIATAVLVTALMTTACAPSDSASAETQPVEQSATVHIERPTRPDIPWAETPEQIRSGERCPADLPVDTITPADEASVALEQVAAIPSASALAFAPDGTGYIGTRDGLVLSWTPGAEPVAALDLTETTSTERDQGLLGLAVVNDYLLINRTDLDNDSLLEAFQLIDGQPSTNDPVLLLRADQPSREHNGGDIVIGPDDHLYLTVGDGGAQGGPFVTGRQAPHAFGSLLRFGIEFDPEPRLITAEDNPFAGPLPGSDHTWVWGLRHPYRFSFDAATGDLWIADVGQLCIEEVTVLPGGGAGGEHLGWNSFEGNAVFMDVEIESHVPPTFSYAHKGGHCAVIGGHVYRGDVLTDLVGKYVFADFCKRGLISYDPDTGALQELQSGTVSPVALVIAPDGLLYVVDLAQGIWRVDPV